MSWPPEGICGFSSKGWKCSSALSSPCSCASACSSADKPMAHQGQEMSETQSILREWVMVWLIQRSRNGR